MSESEWQPRCEALAHEIRAACAIKLAPIEVRAEDRSDTMYAEEEDPNVVPYYPIGVIFRFRIRARRTYRLFGRAWLPIRYWSTLVRFGMEDMRASPGWALRQGLWCAVPAEDLADTVKPVVADFAMRHRLRLEFA